jgi:hypothetical protein
MHELSHGPLGSAASCRFVSFADTRSTGHGGGGGPGRPPTASCIPPLLSGAAGRSRDAAVLGRRAGTGTRAWQRAVHSRAAAAGPRRRRPSRRRTCLPSCTLDHADALAADRPDDGGAQARHALRCAVPRPRCRCRRCPPLPRPLPLPRLRAACREPVPPARCRAMRRKVLRAAAPLTLDP